MIDLAGKPMETSKVVKMEVVDYPSDPEQFVVKVVLENGAWWNALCSFTSSANVIFNYINFGFNAIGMVLAEEDAVKRDMAEMIDFYRDRENREGMK